MSNTILLKRSDVANSVPSTGNLVPGELALNFADGNLFFKNSSNNIVLLASTQTLDIAGNITGGNLITAGITSTAALSVTGNAGVGNLSTVGQVIATGNITGGNLSGTNITGTLLTAAQNNITSVGTLTSLLVTGNVGVGTITPVAKIEINIAASETALTAARLNLNSAASASETIPVTNPSLELRRGSMGRGTFVKFINQRPGFAGIGSTADADNGHDLRFHTGDGTEHMLIDSAGNVSATGNVAAGNITTAGLISATGNITGGNLITAGAINATGNVSGNFFLGNGSQLTGINTFSTISVAGQSNVVADSISDTLTFAAGSGIALLTDAANDVITIATIGTGDSIFATGGSMGTIEEAVTAEEDLGLIVDAIIEQYDLGLLVLGGLIYPDQLVLPSYTVAELADISTFPAGQMVFVTDESGGSIPAFSDGTDWRRVTDRQIVS